VPLTHVDILNNYKNYSFLVNSYIFKSYLWTSIFLRDPFHKVVSVILFIVRVPVLSEQILLAPPIV